MLFRSGCLLADAGDPRQARHVTSLHGGDELAGFDPRQHGDGQLRADAADADQPLEQLLLERRREAEELQRVFAHVGVDVQRHRRARLDRDAAAANSRAFFVRVLRPNNDLVLVSVPPDWIETQLETIKQVGAEKYLSEQIHKDS